MSIFTEPPPEVAVVTPVWRLIVKAPIGWSPAASLQTVTTTEAAVTSVVKLMLMVLRKPLNVPLPTVDDCAALRFIAYERATALVLVSASEVVLGIRW